MAKKEQIVNKAVDGDLVVSIEGKRVRVIKGCTEPVKLDGWFRPGLLLDNRESERYLRLLTWGAK